jgi:Xaa-Pro aminopeptidase
VEARHAAEGVVAAFRRLAELLSATVERDGELWLEGERLRVGRLRREVARELAGHGLEQPEGNIFALGGDAAVPHTQGSSEIVMKPRESLVVDLFPRALLFADCTRTFCVGEPSEALRRAHAAVADALQAAQLGAGPGASAWELNRAAADRLEEAGYSTIHSRPGIRTGFVHGLGHGVGYELHELPSFARDASPEDGTLEEGDLITLEPGLYDPEAAWGVRLENLGLVEEAGFRLLTDLPLEMDPRAWS